MTNKKRVKSVKSPLLPIPDWKHADLSVRRIGELQGQIAKLEVDTSNSINKLKEELAAKVKPLQGKITLHFDSLEAFATTHREYLKSQKSRKLNFGIIGWRFSSSIKPSKKTLELIKQVFLPALQKSCIIIKESVSRDALAKLTDEQLADIKARRDEKDVFFVEPNSQKAADYE